MPEYIPRPNPQLIGEIINAYKANQAYKERRIKEKEEAVQKVFSTVNEFYKDKEAKAKEKMMMVEAMKDLDIKRGMAAKKMQADILEKFQGVQPEYRMLPTGLQGLPGIPQPFYPEGVEKAPPELQEILGTAGFRVRPREFAPAKPETLIGEAGSKAFLDMGINLPPETPISVANTIGRTKIAERRAVASSKVDQAYKELSDMVQTLPGIPMDKWSEKDKANYQAWLTATKAKGITIQDIAVLSQDAPPEEKTMFDRILALMGWKKPEPAISLPKSAPAKPAVKSSKQDRLGLFD